MAAVATTSTATAAGAAGGALVVPPAFVALGDWGRDGLKAQRDVADSMAAAADEIGSRFVISVGDNFYPCGVGAVDDPQWKSSFEDIYAAPSLQTPWYAALGNHDYRGVPHAQIAYSQVSPRWRMPSRYFTVSGASVGIPQLDIFFLDTTPLLASYSEAFQQLRRGRLWIEDAGQQVRWLRSVLTKSVASWKIVIGHHPIRSGGHHGDTPALVAAIKPLLELHGVQAYLCGHDHALQHIRDTGVNYICTGAGASAGLVRPVEGMLFRGGRPGFAMFAFEDDELRLTFRDDRGRTAYTASMKKAPT